MTGVVVLADWLASQDHFVLRQQTVVPSSATAATITSHLAAPQPAACALLDEAGLTAPGLRSVTFEECFPFQPNALQRSLLDELLPRLPGPGLLLVTAATGDGKTEAALTAARALAEVRGVNGFYFALPTMATSDEMYRRVRDFAAKIATGPAPVTLLHSMSWLNAEYGHRVAAWAAAPSGVFPTPSPSTHQVVPRAGCSGASRSLRTR